MKKKIALLAVAFGLLLPGVNAFAALGWESGVIDNLKSTSGNGEITDKDETTFIELAPGETISFEFPTKSVFHYRLLSDSGLEISIQAGTSRVSMDAYYSVINGDLAELTQSKTYRNKATGIHLRNRTSAPVKVYDFELYEIENLKPGLLNGKSIPFKNSAAATEPFTTTKNITDKDLATSYNISTFTDGNYYMYEFETAMQIDSFEAITSTHASSMALKTYDVSGELIETINSTYREVDGYRFYKAASGNDTPIKRVEFSPSTGSGYSLYEFEIYGGEPPAQPAGEINSLKTTASSKEVNFTWDLPQTENYKSVIVYRDNIKIAEFDGTSYTDQGVTSGEIYEYKISTLSLENAESEGVIKVIEIPMPEPVADIKNLNATATHEKINLSWELPRDDRLHHVNIYRDELTEVSFLDKVTGTITAQAAETKIFETNGTYFNDLTVKPETEYEYTLTTYSTEGMESSGVTATVTTAEAPPPEIIGGEYTKDPATGDFIYSWDEPTEGQVKVQLDGVDYKTVDSADQQIRIPKSEMKYDSLGSPLISLQPIGENGKVGEIVAPGVLKDLKIPFGPSDLLGAGVSLVGVVSGIIILFLSFLLVPRLLRVIKKALGKESAKEAAARNERTRQRVERLERNKKASAAERLAKTPKTEKEAKEPKTAASDKIASTERQRKQTLSYATGPVAKEPRTKRERIKAERQTKAPRIPRERNRRERTPRERG